MRDKLKLLTETTDRKECISIQREIIADKSFKPVKNIKGVWSAVSESDPDYDRLLAGAKKAAAHGYEVYILPNPKGIRSADYIFKKQSFIGTYDLKTIMGDKSVGNRLAESIGQTKRVLLNMATNYNPRQLAKEIRTYFETNSEALEVKIFKGGKEISIKYKDTLNADFVKDFIKLFER